MKINENKLAMEVSMLEGGKVGVNIAQIKEVIKLLLQELAKYKASEVLALMEKR